MEERFIISKEQKGISRLTDTKTGNYNLITNEMLTDRQFMELQEKQLIEGKTYDKNAWIEVDKDGSITRFSLDEKGNEIIITN